jgi:hypothetical protein
MAAAVGISEATVRRIWHKHGLKPHLVETFKVSTDPHFAEKLEAVVGLYLNPPEHALVLCCDEKSQIQALDRTQPGLPLKRGRAGTMTHDHKRNGTASRVRFQSGSNEQRITRGLRLFGGQIDERAKRLPQLLIVRILRDTDDLHITSSLEMLPDGILAGHILLDEQLVNNRDARGFLYVAVSEIATCQQLLVQGLEIIQTDHVKVRLNVGTFCRVSWDFNVERNHAAVKGCHHRQMCSSEWLQGNLTRSYPPLLCCISKRP